MSGRTLPGGQLRPAHDGPAPGVGGEPAGKGREELQGAAHRPYGRVPSAAPPRPGAAGAADGISGPPKGPEGGAA